MDCIFCSIAEKKSPAFVLYEDENALAVLDIYPIKRGQTVVFPKVHSDSNFSHAPYTVIENTLTTAHKTAALLEKKLGYDRTFIVIQGLGVNHFHIKLYPKHADDHESLKIYLPESREKEAVLKELYTIIKG